MVTKSEFERGTMVPGKMTQLQVKAAYEDVVQLIARCQVFNLKVKQWIDIDERLSAFNKRLTEETSSAL